MMRREALREKRLKELGIDYDCSLIVCPLLSPENFMVQLCSAFKTQGQEKQACAA